LNPEIELATIILDEVPPSQPARRSEREITPDKTIVLNI
jgi:hypothetical protein